MRVPLPIPTSSMAGADFVTQFFNCVISYAREECIVFPEGKERITWQEFGARVDKMQCALVAKGIKKGDRVAILGYNSPRYLEAFVAALAVGGCVVPLPTMASAESTAMMIGDAKCKAVFVEQSFANLIPQSPALLRVGIDFSDGTFQGWDALLKAGEGTPVPQVELTPEDEFDIVYSSGTTGTPKGIVHLHKMRTASCAGLGSLGFSHGDTTLVSTSLYSNTTMTGWVPSLARGAKMVLMQKNNIDLFLQYVQDERVTHFMAVPVQYDRLANHPRLGEFDLSSIRLKTCTSAPFRPELKAQVLQRIPGTLWEFYGLTEGGIGTTFPVSYHPDKLASVGKPNAGGSLLIVDTETGAVLPTGKTGEIVGRNNVMMKGYEGSDEKTKKMCWTHPETKEIYFRSGDVGRLDEDGFLFLSDRLKDMIISGGFNVYADDLELALQAHPAVHEAAVVAAFSRQWGETPVAYVVLKQGAGASPEPGALRAFANKALGKHQRISEVHLIDALPRSDIGKILKRQLRDLHWPKPKL